MTHAERAELVLPHLRKCTDEAALRLLAAEFAAATTVEREACAAVAELFAEPWAQGNAEFRARAIATGIRMRTPGYLGARGNPQP